LIAALSGCATPRLDESLAQTNRDAQAFTQGQLALYRSAEERIRAKKQADELLKAPLDQAKAVHVALLNSPALQALLAQSWADASRAAQSGRIPNPLLSLERLQWGDELEWSRMFSFGLFDLLTLPRRQAIAQQRLQAERLRLTSDVVDHITQVRQAWVRAVAAQQNVMYARQVAQGAEAGAELAKRLEAVGNFNRLSQARQRLFFADAHAQLMSAEQTVVTARENLVRLLGLSDEQAPRLQLLPKLPDLPAKPSALDVLANASVLGSRLDVRLSAIKAEEAAHAQGLSAWRSWGEVELGLKRHSTSSPTEGRRSGKGFELSLPVPLFDAGDATRAAMNAQTLAATQQLEATRRAASSHLREGYAAYRSAYDIARHQIDEVLPLRKQISDEQLLRYNGMLIGVFELLADAREQVTSVMTAIRTQEQFWLADAALQAELVGKPVSVMAATPLTSGMPGDDASAH
jgi:outer membrane protein TolC